MKITTIPLKQTHEFNVQLPGTSNTADVSLHNVQQFDISIPSNGVAHEFIISMPGVHTGTLVLHKPSTSYVSLGDLTGTIIVTPRTTPLYCSRILNTSGGSIIITAAQLPLGGMDEWTIGDYADDLAYLLRDMDLSTLGTLSGRKPV